MKKCLFCRFYQNGTCRLPIWMDGKKYEGWKTEPENLCDLFEALVTVVEDEEGE